jgi:hypothetical protein
VRMLSIIPKGVFPEMAISPSDLTRTEHPAAPVCSVARVLPTKSKVHPLVSFKHHRKDEITTYRFFASVRVARAIIAKFLEFLRRHGNVSALLCSWLSVQFRECDDHQTRQNNDIPVMCIPYAYHLRALPSITLKR